MTGMDDERNTARPESVIRRRILMLAAVFVLWLLAALARAWYIAVPGRGKYIAAGEAMARRVVVPARRGRILDAEGERLAWTELVYDLESAAPKSAPLTGTEIAELKRVIPDLDPSGRVLRRNLAPGEFRELAKLIGAGVRVKIVGRSERIVIDSPGIRRRVGKVAVAAGSVRGISGWEREFDAELAGSPGRMSVMLDRRGGWIRQSIKVLAPTVDGRDVRLKRTLRELEEPSGGSADVR